MYVSTGEDGEESQAQLCSHCGETVIAVFATLPPHANVGVLISCAVSSHGAQRLRAAGGSVYSPGTGEGLRQRVPFRSPQEVSHSAFTWRLKRGKGSTPKIVHSCVWPGASY